MNVKMQKLSENKTNNKGTNEKTIMQLLFKNAVNERKLKFTRLSFERNKDRW